MNGKLYLSATADSMCVSHAWQEEGFPRLDASLDAAYRALTDAARVVARAMADSKLEVDIEEFAKRCVASRHAGVTRLPIPPPG